MTKIFALGLAVLAGSITPTSAAEFDGITLSNGGTIKVSDIGFDQVFYIDEGLGILVEKTLKIPQADGTERTRALTLSDLREACAVVLSKPEVRVAGAPPDYIFFLTVKRKTGFLGLRKTEKVFFETRTNRCRKVDQPEEPK